MKKTLMLLMAMMLLSSAAWAVPAYPVKKTVKLADGSTVTVTLRGDEHMHFYVTDDGVALREMDNGIFRPYTAEELDHMQASAAKSMSKARQRNQAQKPGSYTGQHKGLVILVNFKDNAFSIDNANEVYNDFFNKKGYSDYGMSGSVSDYFAAQSYGQFEMSFDVKGPYTLKYDMSYYGRHDEDQHDANADAMIEEAVKAANPEVNYADYDWDKDGWVDQVFVVYAGYGENYGASDNCIWPHKSTISYKNVRLDNRNIGTYACSCELSGNSGTTLDGIGTPCHEFSHCLGLADHYDTQYVNYGPGDWDLMCSGSYNNNTRTPAAYTAYERWMCGWLEPVEVNSETEVKDMKPITEAPEAYVLYNDGHPDEYYLLENRQKQGFDSSLPGHGLLVFHINYDKDKWDGNSVNVGEENLSIIPADNNIARNADADPFPGKRNVTSLTDYTTPKAALANPNTDGSMLMHKAIEHISESADGHISMLLARPNLEVPELTADITSPNSITVNWNSIDRATEYEVQFQDIPAKQDISDAIVLNEDFAKFYKSSAGLKDISGELSQYTSANGYAGSKLYQSPDLLRIGSSTVAGFLYTPVLAAPQTGIVTIEMKMKPYKDNTTVEGVVHLQTNTPATTHDLSLSVEEEQTLVLHNEIPLFEIFRVDIKPSSAVYLKGLTIYDGNFTAEEIEASKTGGAKMKAPKIEVFKTTETSYTFNNLNPDNRYVIKVRAINDEQQSDWSEEVEIDMQESNGIEETVAAPAGNDVYYDLSGRRVATPKHGLYIVNGKKVIK